MNSGKLTIIIPNIKTGGYEVPNIKYDVRYDLPENNKTCFQRVIFAKELVKDVCGRKILLITNCDFIIREINNCIMLSYDFDGKSEFMAKHGYNEKHCLSPENVKGFYCGDKEIEVSEINKYGLKISEICNVINDANDVSDFLSDKMEELESDTQETD